MADDRTSDRDDRKQGHHDQDKPGRFTDGLLRKVMGGVVGLCLGVAFVVVTRQYLFLEKESVDIDVVFLCLSISMFAAVVVNVFTDGVVSAVAGGTLGAFTTFYFRSYDGLEGVMVACYVYLMIVAPNLQGALFGAIAVVCFSLLWFLQ